MNVLAVIPARGGSKGVPRKNIRPCAGKPLLVWSIEAALASRYVRQSGMVVVSSDDAEMLAVAQRASTQVVAQERPADLATDEATTDSVLRYVVRNLAGYRPDLVVLLQATVPVRRPGLVDACIERLLGTDADCVWTGRPMPYVWKNVGRGEWAETSDWRTYNPKRLRRQDLPECDLRWEEDGSVYVTRAGMIEHGRRIGGRVQVLQNERTVDIDTLEDFVMAEALLRSRQEQEAIAC